MARHDRVGLLEPSEVGQLGGVQAGGLLDRAADDQRVLVAFRGDQADARARDRVSSALVAAVVPMREQVARGEQLVEPDAERLGGARHRLDHPGREVARRRRRLADRHAPVLVEHDAVGEGAAAVDGDDGVLPHSPVRARRGRRRVRASRSARIASRPRAVASSSTAVAVGGEHHAVALGACSTRHHAGDDVARAPARARGRAGRRSRRRPSRRSGRRRRRRLRGARRCCPGRPPARRRSRRARPEARRAAKSSQTFVPRLITNWFVHDG